MTHSPLALFGDHAASLMNVLRLAVGDLLAMDGVPFMSNAAASRCRRSDRCLPVLGTFPVSRGRA